MQVPPQIVLKEVQTTPYIDKVIARGIAGLERECNYLISVRIALERVQGRHQMGNPYRMRIAMRVPDRAEITVQHSSKVRRKTPDDLSKVQVQMALKGEPEPEKTPLMRRSPIRGELREEPLLALIRRTFNLARRELKKVVEKQRGQVKTPAQRELQAVVEKIFRDQSYGFLRTLDGQPVYFHKNSVLHKNWDRLTLGTVVRYNLEMGENGPQASSVQAVDKPGVAEMHDQLHDLPNLVPARRRKAVRTRKGTTAI